MSETRFTKRSDEVEGLALMEASRFKHDHIDPAHLLVGLLREEKGVASRVLSASGVTLEAVRERLGATLGYGQEDTSFKAYTLRSKKILELAFGAMRRLGHERMDTEHLLLAVASEPEGAAAKILSDLGINQRELRANVMSFIGEEDRTGIISGGLGEEDSIGIIWLPNDELDPDVPNPPPAN